MQSGPGFETEDIFKDSGSGEIMDLRETGSIIEMAGVFVEGYSSLYQTDTIVLNSLLP